MVSVPWSSMNQLMFPLVPEYPASDSSEDAAKTDAANITNIETMAIQNRFDFVSIPFPLLLRLGAAIHFTDAGMPRIELDRSYKRMHHLMVLRLLGILSPPPFNILMARGVLFRRVPLANCIIGMI